MKIWLCILMMICVINAENTDCVMLFEARKDEIKNEILKLDEQKQALEAYRASLISLSEENIKKIEAKKKAQEQDFLQKQSDLNASLAKISQKEREISQKLAQNEKILQEIKSLTSDKVSQTYSKMKDQAAADVLAQMSAQEATNIMYSLSPKKIAAIIAKMQPSFASQITLLLKKGAQDERNFDQNLTADDNKSAEIPQKQIQ